MAVALVALVALHHTPRAALARPVAVQAALRATRQASGWKAAHWDHVTVGAVDTSLTRVAFWEGGQIVGEVALHPDGTPDQVQLYAGRPVPFGSELAYQPAVLVLLAALFVLATAVLPLARLRNFDVLAALSLVAPVVLLSHRYVSASVLAALPGLLWLGGRGGRLALGGAVSGAPQVPLLDALSPGWSSQQRVRLLRLLVVTLALVYLMVGISSSGPVDVIYGVMEGATKLLSGILPYGHLPGDVIHGDTYPIASYALYAPLAWLAPVHSTWDSVDLALGAGGVVTLLTAWLTRTAARRAGGPRAEARDVIGLRAALTWLAFPPLLIAVSSGTTDVLLAALIVGALCVARRPALSSGLVALAGWVKLAPFALLPMLLAARRGRALRGALGAVLAVSAASLGLLMALGGTAGPSAMVHAIAFQFTRGSPQSVWSVLDVPGLQMIAQAAVIGAVLAGAIYARRHPVVVEDPLRLAGLAMATLIGLELVTDYWSVLYLAWIAGLLPLSVLAPVPVPVAVEAMALRSPARAAPVSALT
jgi:hypothetical protein